MFINALVRGVFWKPLVMLLSGVINQVAKVNAMVQRIKNFAPTFLDCQEKWRMLETSKENV